MDDWKAIFKHESSVKQGLNNRTNMSEKKEEDRIYRKMVADLATFF